MKHFRLFATVLFALALTTGATADDLTLRYEQPSQTWMGSLPLGNGRLGAMVYGGTQRETIALSELTLWSGQPDTDCNNMLGPDRLREIRSAFLNGDYKLGNEMGWRSMNGHGRSFGTNANQQPENYCFGAYGQEIPFPEEFKNFQSGYYI